MSTNSASDRSAIDWSKWQPAGEGDVRSPCPMLNALANHHVLPHDGRGITKEMAVNALANSINLDPSIGKIFSSVATQANPDHSAHAFDLNHVNKHGLIEHDGSLSRSDAAMGDNHTLDREVWKSVMETYGDSEHTSFELSSKARYDRIRACKAVHEAAKTNFEYGIKEFILSYGETALFLAVLGDPKDGKIPLEYLKILFEQERLPFNEGWRPSQKPITQTEMNHLIFSLIKVNPHKAEEATQVGLGTVQAVTSAVTNLLPHYCNVM